MKPERPGFGKMLAWVIAIDAALAVIVWGAYRIW